jgi:CHAT domain-containing protein/Tfp pilus assembly protein PilF
VIAFGSTVLAALALQSSAADSLILLAQSLPESQLVLEVRARPLSVRDAVSEALARAVRRPAARDEHLSVAGKLAAGYAIAWSDSFLMREVARFDAWSPDRRAMRVWADSVRREGNGAFARDGPAAAIVVWRRALARFQAIPDTTGIAAVLGNVGGGFYEIGDSDSAGTYLEHSRALARAVGDKRVEANATGLLAGIREDRGDIGGARRGYARALVLREAIGDSRGVASTYNNLGVLAQNVGDLDESRRQFEAALAINRRDGREEVAATNLVNLAGLASLTGDFPRAERLYRDALATWRAQEQWAHAADALHGLGQLEVRRGDYASARAALAEALAIYQRTDQLADALDVRQELAAVLSAQGDLQGALDELRRVQDDVDAAFTAPALEAGLALARADLAVQLNALADAERLYAQAEALYREAGDAGGVAEAQQGLGMLFVLREDYARAQALLGGAMRTQYAIGSRRAAALTRLAMGQLARERGEPAVARRELTQAGAELERLGDAVGAAAVLGERAALEADVGLVARAESLYRAGLDRLGRRVAPDVAWQLHAGLGLALRARGMLDAAAAALRQALIEIERSGRSLTLAERRAAFLADKWDVYAQLALIERSRGRLGAAFEASERLRAREMLELLARGRVFFPEDAPDELMVREQDLRRRIGELTRDLEATAGGNEALRGPDVSRAAESTREALVLAQGTYAELLLEMRERAPQQAALVSPVPVTWRDVARRLAPDEVFIEYLVSDSGTVAFAVTRDTIAVVELGVARREVSRRVDFVRGTLTPGRSQTVDTLWRRPLSRLHAQLMRPIEATRLLAGKTRLVLVPHAELHYLPFAALLDGGGRFMMERYHVVVAPSASVWVALAERGPRSAREGVLALAPRPDRLPASRREIAAIGRIAGADALVVSGNAASEAVFRREAPRRRVLHLATYGVLNKHNPLFSFVELAPGNGHDGRLEVHEVFGLDLAADLVVLSACQTGLGSGVLADIPAGDDWVGLTRAFLHAGASQVVATLWPVEDWATAALMERFYDAYTSGGDPALALSRAQRALLAAPATAHPFYWAGFVTVGSAPGGAP